MAKVRKRNVTKDVQKGKMDDGDSTKREETAKTSGSNNGIIIVLIIMIGVTWGIAATAYFGIVDYKGLVDLVKRDEATQSPDVTDMKHENVVKEEVVVKEEKSKPTEQEKAKPEPTKQYKPKTEGKEDKKPVTESKQVKQKDKTKKPKTLSDEDKLILDKLKEGEKLLAQKKGNQAWKFFQDLVAKNPESPKARFNKAKAEEMLAEQQRSNPMLTQAIKSFGEVAEMKNAPKELRKQALLAKSEKEMFLGRMKPALDTQLALAKMYPQDIEVLNKLGVRFLMLGRNPAAREVYDKVLKLKPDDGFAQVHMGFIMKNAGEWAASIPYLSQGTESNAPGTQEGKFYFHLGDALHRTNRTKEAEKVYEKAARKGLFRSKYQRSLYNVDRLRGKPFWTPEEAGVKDYVRRLEMNWKTIRDEALAAMNAETGSFQLEEESLRDTGEWRQFTLFQRGDKVEANCRRTPKTCNIVERMPNARGCRRGQIKYSVMMPGTHVWPHTGPTNCRLRMHLGLVIPKTGSGARLACAGEMKTWEEGKVLIFDDSFEHEVWQEAESLRLILIVDIWHPDLTEHEKKTLTSI